MENTFEKILKDGERKGYFRVLNDGAKIEYLPTGHKENLSDPEEKVRAEYYFVSSPENIELISNPI